MSTQEHALISRLIQAALIFALCAALGGSAFAGGRSYRPADKDDSSKNAAAEHKITTGGGTSYRPDQSPASKTAGPVRGGEPAFKTGRDDHGTTSYKPGAGQRGTTSYKPDSSDRWGDTPRRRSDRRSDTGYRPNSASHPDTYYKQGSDRRPNTAYRPDTGYRPDSDRSASYRPGAIHVDTGRDNYYQQPKSYKPPTYRSGHYYYDSRPHYRPCYYGDWVFDHDPAFSRRSAYFHYGYFPYVRVTRVYVSPYVSINTYGTPIYIDGRYQGSRAKYSALDETLSDIRNAWVDSRFDLIESHVDASERIAVLLDGDYDYSIDSDDYLRMTHDTIDEVTTVGFSWDRVAQRSDGSFTAYATHRYRDSSDGTKTVYISYTLHKTGGDYYITEVDSSVSRLY